MHRLSAPINKCLSSGCVYTVYIHADSQPSVMRLEESRGGSGGQHGAVLIVPLDSRS